MMFLPEEHQVSLTSRYKLTSIQTISNNIKRIYIEIFGLSTFTNLEPLLDTNKVIQSIDDKSITVKQNLMTAILAVLRYPPKNININPQILDIYDKYATDIVKKSKEIKEFHVRNEKETMNWLPWGSIITKYNEYNLAIQPLINKLPKNKNELITFQRYIILLIYTQIPPLRCQEYLDAIINNDVPGKNTIDLINKKFIVKHHKTVNSHGIKIIDLPEIVITRIKEWQQFNGYRDYLFISLNKNAPMDRICLLQQFHKIFEPYKIGPTMLRKIYISEILTWNISMDERKKIANIMGHTIETQEFTYKKID